MLDEDWPILMSFIPDNWAELAMETKALRGLRKDKDLENYLRVLLIHLGCGYSMRETAARAKLSGLADISDVALMGRLKKSKDWLHDMCVALFKEQGIVFDQESNFQVRLFDATNVKESGKTGSLWRIHYSVSLPTLTCDFFKISATKGQGTGESFFQYPIKKGDYVIADRGYSTAAGIHQVASKKAFVMVRVNTRSLPINCLTGGVFPLLKNVGSVEQAGDVKSWEVSIPSSGGANVRGRLCVVRKSNEAIILAQKKLSRIASKKGYKIKPRTLEYAKYVIIFTTFPKDSFTDLELLDWYRVRWQVELTFKRFKSIAQLGHLPKHNDDSSKAWLYGKLFVALLTERLIQYACSVSPWGYELEEHAASERLA